MSAEPEERPDPGVRILAAQVAGLTRRIRDMEQAAQMEARSIDDGALEVYDDDDELRGRIGKQPDGAFAVKSYGKKPETPTEPDVIPVPGGCIVEWDGTFEDAQTDDVQRIAIHVGETNGFAIVTGDDEESDVDSTEKAAILSPRGGSAFLALDPGVSTYYVRLTAIAEGGIESDPSPSVEVIIATPEVAFYQDVFTLTKTGGQQLDLTFEPVENSEHLYWNGLYQREDQAWSRIRKGIDLTGEPYEPKVGDKVVVEYAYLTGEQPDDSYFNRGTPNGAWLISTPSGAGVSWRCTFHISFIEPVLTEHYGPLLYTGPGSDLNNHSLQIAWYINGTEGLTQVFGSYTQRGIPYTSWGEGDGNSGGEEGDPHIYRHWSLYHSLAIPGDEHPHQVVGCQVWPYGTIQPAIGTTDPRAGKFWLGPRIVGKPRPWRNFGRP